MSSSLPWQNRGGWQLLNDFCANMELPNKIIMKNINWKPWKHCTARVCFKFLKWVKILVVESNGLSALAKYAFSSVRESFDIFLIPCEFQTTPLFTADKNFKYCYSYIWCYYCYKTLTFYYSYCVDYAVKWAFWCSYAAQGNPTFFTALPCHSVPTINSPFKFSSVTARMVHGWDSHINPN